MSGAAVRALVVDDSAVVRQVLSSVLTASGRVQVMGAVQDPVFAMERMNREWPDVIVLDLEMPRMDGLTFLRKVMAVRPTPVVVCSTLTVKGTQTVVDALAAGAVGVVAKPVAGLRQFLEEDAGDLVAMVVAAGSGDSRRLRGAAVAAAHAPAAAGVAPVVPAPRPAGGLARTTDLVVAVGTSTGGTQALETVLTALPRLDVGVVVVQHMPEHFTAAFADRLDALCALDVREAVDGDRVLAGHVLVAPGGRHTRVVRDGAQYRVQVRDGERVNRHKPSVDVLMDSVAQAVGPNALGVILTGMGEDGARGLLAMRQAGARTLGQDEATSVVYGMPEAAYRLGAVERQLPLGAVPGAVQQWAVGR